MILQAPEPLRAVEDFASELGARKLSETTHTPEESNQGIVRELAWELSTGLQLHYLEDFRSSCSFIVIAGVDDEKTAEISALISSYLDTWSEDDILLAVEDSVGPEDRARAILRAGVGAPERFDESFWYCIGRAMSDPDSLVRSAAVWATSYPFWRQFIPLLEKVATEDSDPDLRAEAQALALGIAREAASL